MTEQQIIVVAFLIVGAFIAGVLYERTKTPRNGDDDAN